MRCTVTPCGLDLGPGFRTQRRLRDPAEDGHHLSTPDEVWMKKWGNSRNSQLFPDRISLRPISESKDQKWLQPTLHSFQTEQPSAPKRRCQRRRARPGYRKKIHSTNDGDNFFSYIPVGDIQHLGLSEHRVPQNLTLDHHCPNSIAILWG